MKALANEIAKNLVLAGIGSMTIVDSESVVDDDLGSQFFVSDQHLGMNVRLLSTSKSSPSTNANAYSSGQRQRHHKSGSSTRESCSMSTLRI